MPGELIAGKIVNALVPDAQLAPGLAWYLNYQTLGLDRPAFNWMRRLAGGLWVGGELCLDDERLVFTANAINRATNVFTPPPEMRLSAITAVTCRFGLFTGIVDVDFGGKRFTFRCYGSKAFAQKIRAAAGVS